MSLWPAVPLLIAATLAAGPATAGERAFETTLRDVRNLHRAEMQRSGIAGSSFYVLRDGRIVAADLSLIHISDPRD